MMIIRVALVLLTLFGLSAPIFGSPGPLVTTHHTTDITYQNESFVAEGRIGDLGGAATFELDIGPTTAAPAQTAQYNWPNGIAEPFILTYNSNTGLVTFAVGDKVLYYTPAAVSTDIYIRTRAVNVNTSIIVDNLVLDGVPVNDLSSTANPGDGVHILQISGGTLSDGFTLTGQSTMTWVGSPPTQSKLAYQIKIADGRSDLSISKSASPEPVLLGQDLTYTIDVTNNGPSNASGVTVTDVLPAGVMFMSLQSSPSCTEGPVGTVVCGVGTLANGATDTVTIVVQPNAVGTLTNTASVTGNEYDPDASNNDTPNVYTTVNPPTILDADLSITKSDSPDPVLLPGDPLTYTITVSNNGPNGATNVVVTDTLPGGVSFLSASSDPRCSEITPGTVECTIGNLSNGAFDIVTIVVQTSVAEVIGNYASVTADQTDPDLSNNDVLETTNVGDLSRLVNISTRGFVDTGENVMIGGFWIGGSLPKRIYIRARGPSLANFGVAGAMANPTMELYSGPTLIAQNNDWQDAPQCAGGYTCYDAAAIAATGLSPCSVTTAGCTLDSGILIELPAGGYTAILKGVNNGTGVGIVEVFDPDTGSLPKIVNISTRGLVLTGDNVMIGGFWIGAGGGQKSVLVRARGPSLANFGVAGAMENPTLELYSGATKIAQNNDWQTTDALCGSPAVACGSATDIQNTGLDPCSVTTAGCTLDSAIHVTLPPGGYTAILSGMNNGTGVGIVEVFELGQ